MTSQLCPQCGRDNRNTGRFCAYCRVQLPGLPGRGIVQQGRYHIQGLLGCGGMGAVYLAQDNRIAGRSVAVKESLDTGPYAQTQFQSEVKF